MSAFGGGHCYRVRIRGIARVSIEARYLQKRKESSIQNLTYQHLLNSLQTLKTSK
nr:hypothetical protein [uncultured bacterium]